MSYGDKIAKTYTGVPKASYLYKVRATGELVAVEMCVGEKNERDLPGNFLILPDGAEASRAFREELQRDGFSTDRPKPRQQRAGWPMVSSNAGVNPSQHTKLEALWRAKGITGCRVLPDGDIEYADRASRKRDHEARGLYDRSGGYGDAQPKHL